MKKPNKPTKAILRRQLKEAHASRASTYHFADATLDKAANRIASGVVIEITAIGGAEIIPPTMILNGLSDATISAIRADLARSWLYATEMMPRKALATSQGKEFD